MDVCIVYHRAMSLLTCDGLYCECFDLRGFGPDYVRNLETTLIAHKAGLYRLRHVLLYKALIDSVSVSSIVVMNVLMYKGAGNLCLRVRSIFCPRLVFQSFISALQLGCRGRHPISTIRMHRPWFCQIQTLHCSCYKVTTIPILHPICLVEDRAR